ncbi:MAG: hypothetical protein QXT63_01720 [Thermoplasmata archaeon]
MDNIPDNEKLKLKEIIQKELLVEPKSISSLSRALAKKGINIHRLTLTGYLNALADLGFLEEKTILPSKVYSLVKGSEKDIYSDLRKVIDRYAFGEDRIRLAIFSLQYIFSRPVFLEELRKMDLEVSLATIPQDIQRVVGNARIYAKKKAELNRLELPQNDPAFELKIDDSNDNESKEWIKKLENIITDLLRFSYGVKTDDFPNQLIVTKQNPKEDFVKSIRKEGKKNQALSKSLSKSKKRKEQKEGIDTLDSFIR